MQKIAKENTNCHQLKKDLFNKLKSQGIFWSYDKESDYKNFPEALIIEHTLKYADYDDIISLFNLYERSFIFAVWEKTVKSDLRFIKTNLMLARVFFRMDIEADYFRNLKNERAEKLRLLAT
ncbi:hypothetical protein EDC55_1226 [Allofrancisella inopinata]|uniref:Uncharacterized protein n=1 Tax=Allofrancisella inopinata TaxID=1085647 RepID=A0AAE6YHB0_9GAMM|nr:hypothetical protein [Allofrancisella inopinata]QIV95723.1 hypothetical protein E4K63_02310 [Allofrancisella inopinata]TDT67949.1 hypothetical protein EDC55_1226 [Allofrancisella inopinata]